jgi:hypothetical protein
VAAERVCSSVRMMSSGPDVREAELPAGGDRAELDGSGRWARARESLHVPGALVRLLVRDPQHIPERLTIYAVDRRAGGAREWAQRARAGELSASGPALVEIQRRRTVSTARIDGAIAGTPFFIALVPAYIAFLQQEVRFHLRVAALYGHDLTDPRVAADFLVLRGVHHDREQALAELAVVRATPVPSKGGRTPLRSWYRAVVSILILAGFLSAPDEDEQGPLTRWEKVMRAIRFIVAALIWALTWVVPITFMMLMAWGCENDAQRFSQRVATHYADDGEDAAAAMASADHNAGGNRPLSFARGALILVSVAIPLALIASTLVAGTGLLGVSVPEEIAALVALALVLGVSTTAVRG